MKNLILFISLALFSLTSIEVLAQTVPGCMSSAACNYNASASIDDGTCTFLSANDCPLI